MKITFLWHEATSRPRPKNGIRFYDKLFLCSTDRHIFISEEKICSCLRRNLDNLCYFFFREIFLKRIYLMIHFVLYGPKFKFDKFEYDKYDFFSLISGKWLWKSTPCLEVSLPHYSLVQKQGILCSVLKVQNIESYRYSWLNHWRLRIFQVSKFVSIHVLSRKFIHCVYFVNGTCHILHYREGEETWEGR